MFLYLRLSRCNRVLRWISVDHQKQTFPCTIRIERHRNYSEHTNSSVDTSQNIASIVEINPSTFLLHMPSCRSNILTLVFTLLHFLQTPCLFVFPFFGNVSYFILSSSSHLAYCGFAGQTSVQCLVTKATLVVSCLLSSKRCHLSRFMTNVMCIFPASHAD